MEFAEHVFPYLVHNVLERDDDVARTTLSDQFRNFFSHCNGISVITSSASSPFPSTVPSSNTSGIFGSEWNECQIRLRERGNSKGAGGGGAGVERRGIFTLAKLVTLLLFQRTRSALYS